MNKCPVLRAALEVLNDCMWVVGASEETSCRWHLRARSAAAVKRSLRRLGRPVRM